MKILISNDDGIGAPGIVALEEIARQISDDVYVVAPGSNMSGAGHSLTLKTPLRLEIHGAKHFSVSGTPTDSVVMAIRHIMEKKPDIMLSGINFDTNLAEDITYSGTVAAAMEARLLGIPAIAFSQEMFHDGTVNWEISKKYGLDIIKIILEKYSFPKEILLNVNFPAVKDISEIKGFRITRQGFRAGEDHVIKSVDPRGVPYFWIGSADYRKTDTTKELDTDLGAVNHNYISITPVSLNFTADYAIQSLKEIFS
ncbi:MAG: 5'/3'-nucleotidase SurE [Holosporales bacterium]|jgi:5'-nucleotidase|nr:5'/3'-nucleotidase SurE [Holosporales bacterium]